MADLLKTNFSQLYGLTAAPVDLNSQEFRFTALRPQGNVPIGPLLEQVQWSDQGNDLQSINSIPVLTGEIHYRLPDTKQMWDHLKLTLGDRIRCDVRWKGEWQALWQMRIIQPPALDLIDGSISAQLADDLTLMGAPQEGRFRYVAKKGNHKNGWTYDEIVRDVCRLWKVPVVSLVKGTKRIKNFDPDGQPFTPLEAIRLAVNEEVAWSGNRLVISWRPKKGGGFGLRVAHPAREPYLYTLRGQITAGTVEPIRPAELATAVYVSGVLKRTKGRKTRIHHKELAKASIVQRYGYIERRVSAGTVDSRADLVAFAKRQLAKKLVLRRQITDLQHPGIAFVRRGDAVRVSIPEEGFSGQAGILFVTSVTHTYQPGTYTMSLTLFTKDPLDPSTIQNEKDKAERARKRAAKKESS